MGADGKLAEAAQALASRGIGAQPHDDARAYRAFQRWLPPAVESVSDATLVEYLASRPHWSAGMVRGTAWAIDRHLRRTFGQRAVGPLTRAYISRQKLLLGERALPPVPALLASTAAAITERMEDQPGRQDPAVDAMRQGLVLIRQHADPSAPIADAWDALASLTLRRLGSCTVLRVGDADLQTLASDRVAAWEDAVEVLTNRQRRRRRAASAMTRAGIDPSTPVEKIDDDLWEWLWLMLDPGMPKVIRDRAYLLLGVSHGRRHAELRRANVGDVTASDDGYVITYRDHKNKRRLTYDVVHVTSGPDGCPSHCPACALRELVRLHAAAGHHDGPLLATMYGGEARRMTRQNGRHVVRALNGLVSAPTGSTRSLRAGAATTAWEAGWSLNEIAYLLGHLDPNITELYIRRHERPAGVIQLNLDDRQ